MEEKTLLLVDDTKENIHMLLEILKDYDLLVALNGEKALELSREEKIDLILLDIVMPGMDGYTTCKALKRDKKTKKIPVIFSTAKTDEDSIERAFDVGAVDFITKPFKPKEILSRVKTHLQIQDLIAHLNHISSFDTMTEIYNRRRFFEKATRLFDTRKMELFGVIMDIDRFKRVNDTYGHPTGDRVIKEVASLLKEYLPKEAVYGRIGGEEFAALFPSSDPQQAKQDMESLRKAVGELEIPGPNHERIKTSISLGLVRATEDHKDIDALLRDADQGLYASKQSGRNRCTYRENRP